MLILTFVAVIVIVVGLNFCNEKIFILLLQWSIIVAIDVIIIIGMVVV